MVGWPILVSEVAWLEPSLLTVLVLPVLTWAVLTAGMIGIRTVTSAELQVQSASGLIWSLVGAVVLCSAVSVYFVAVEGWSVLWVSTAYVGVTVGTILWYWRAGLFSGTVEPLSSGSSNKDP
jgi:hypothetical protein